MSGWGRPTGLGRSRSDMVVQLVGYLYSLGLRRLCETTCKRFDTIRTHEGGSVQHCPLLVIDGGHVLGVGLELPVELGGASSKDALQERRLQSWFKEGLKFQNGACINVNIDQSHHRYYKDAKRAHLVLYLTPSVASAPPHRQKDRHGRFSLFHSTCQLSLLLV